MYNELIRKVAKDNDITFEVAFKIISEQFRQLRWHLSKDSPSKSVQLANVFTLKMREKKAAQKLTYFLSLENKRPYAYDQIDLFTRKGISPFSKNP